MRVSGNLDVLLPDHCVVAVVCALVSSFGTLVQVSAAVGIPVHTICVIDSVWSIGGVVSVSGVIAQVHEGVLYVGIPENIGVSVDTTVSVVVVHGNAQALN